MLAGLEDDLQRRLGTCAFADGFRRELKRLAFGDPVLDVVQTTFAIQLVQGRSTSEHCARERSAS